VVAFLVVGSVAISAGRALAHHSFAAEYLGNQEVTLKGQVVSYQFRNPHCSLEIMAPDEHRAEQRWWIEWGGPSQLKGFNRDTLKVGDTVVITAYPSRFAGDHRLRMKTLTRPSDGLTWKGYLE